MPGFSNFMQKAKTSATKFFGSTLPSHAKRAHTFFNSTIVPTVRSVHKGVKAATDTLSADPSLSPAYKEKVSKAAKFSDLGLERFNTFDKTVNNVARAI